MIDTTYLKKRHNTWSVRVPVPPELRKLAGKVALTRTLATHDLAEASRRKHVWVAEFKRQLDDLRKRAGDPETAKARETVIMLKEAVEGYLPLLRDHDAHEFAQVSIEHTLERAREVIGEEAAERTMDAATGAATLVEDLVPQWLAEAPGKEQTKRMYKATAAAYVDWARKSAVHTVEAVTRKVAGRYIGHLLASSGNTRRTIRKYVSTLSVFWQWLAARGHAETNPWTGHGLDKGAGAQTEGKLPYGDDDLVKLLGAPSNPRKNPYDPVVHDIMRLSLFSGMRVEELCGLKTQGVEKRKDGYWINLNRDTTEHLKNANAARQFPVHPALVPIIERRLKDKDVFLLQGLVRGGYDKKRSWQVTKAFARFAARCGVKDPRKDFHSFRRTFAERMEGVGVPIPTIQLIVGHGRKKTMGTTAVYTKGEFVDLRKAIDRLKFSQEVMRLVKQ